MSGIETAQTISVVINTGISVAMQIAEHLRARGHNDEAEQVDALLAHSDAQLREVINKARTAQGLPPLGV